MTDPSALKVNVHMVGKTIQFFDDPVAAQAGLRDPHNGELGSRNVLRGPAYWNLDMGLSKKIVAPWAESQYFTLRVDAFNVTNTNIFGLPSVTLGSSTFGQISGSASAPRELQFAIRFDF